MTGDANRDQCDDEPAALKEGLKAFYHSSLLSFFASFSQGFHPRVSEEDVSRDL